MKKKYYQLVHHTESPFKWYGIHEGVIDKYDVVWVGSKALYKYDSYHTAVANWARIEPLSGEVDIMDFYDAQPLFDRVDYSTHEELDFDL